MLPKDLRFSFPMYSLHYGSGEEAKELQALCTVRQTQESQHSSAPPGDTMTLRYLRSKGWDEKGEKDTGEERRVGKGDGDWQRQGERKERVRVTKR